MNGNEKLTQQMTDDELIAEYLKGNIHYFDSLLKRYEAKLFNYIYRLIGQRQEAENIFQDVFSRVINHMAAYQKNGKFGAWIFKIALNLCRDNLRKRKKMITISLNQQFGSTDSQDCSLENLIASDAPSSSNEVHAAHMQEILQETISCLPDKQREVLTLRIYGKLSFKEISEILHCSINTALARMHYALKYLREKLKEKGVADELR